MNDKQFIRGNVRAERSEIEQSFSGNCTVEHLKRAFEKIGDYKKPIPKIGRPIVPRAIKLSRKIKRVEIKTGQKNLFN